MTGLLALVEFSTVSLSFDNANLQYNKQYIAVVCFVQKLIVLKRCNFKHQTIVCIEYCCVRS